MRYDRSARGAARDREDIEASVSKKASLRLSAEPPGSHVLSEQWAWAVLRIAESVVQDFENRETCIETDEVRERQRPHWMIHSELHHRVDRFGRPHSFHHAIHRLINHRHQNPVRNKAGI